MTEQFQGGCACGAIRYQCSAELLLGRRCHCRDCQRATGGGYGSLVSIPADFFQFLDGEPEFATTTLDSGNTVRRGFCPSCGSPVAGFASAFPELVSIFAGSLDEPSRYKPMMDIFTSSAVPWVTFDTELVAFTHSPTSEQIQELLSK